MSWATTFSTPPRLMPGALSALANRTGTATRMRVVSDTRMKSTCSGLSVTGWNCTSRASARMARPPTSMSKTRVKNPVLCISRTTSRGSRETSSGACFSP